MPLPIALNNLLAVVMLILLNMTFVTILKVSFHVLHERAVCSLATVVEHNGQICCSTEIVGET